jgi:hypothetical protein
VIDVDRLGDGLGISHSHIESRFEFHWIPLNFSVEVRVMQIHIMFNVFLSTVKKKVLFPFS